jgi:hypothetical protein
MQTSLITLGQALRAGAVTWDPLLYADWADDGYGERGSIDDLSGQAGSIQVAHSMDDGMPDEVSFLSGGVPTLRTNLAGREPLDGTEYFSPFRTDSPIFGYDRDVAGVKLDIAAVTAEGMEDIRVFTGIMRDTPVQGGRASLQAASEARVRMSTVVQPQAKARSSGADSGIVFGLTATHPVTWALHKAGMDASPPHPDEGVILWMPLHGSGHAYHPETNMDMQQNPDGMLHAYTVSTAHGEDLQAEPVWIRGPYAGASFAEVTTDVVRAFWGGTFNFNAANVPKICGIADDGQALMMSRDAYDAAAVTRLEFWVRGDVAANVNTTPSGSAIFADTHSIYTGKSAAYVSLSMRYDLSLSGFAMGIDSSRNLYISTWDNTAQNHKRTGPALPSDGEWHFVGLAFSPAGNKVWFNLDGAVTTNTISPSIVRANLPASDYTVDNVLTINTFLPVAEFLLTGYPIDSDFPTIANPDTGNAWLNDQGWEQRSFVYPSCLQLETLSDPTPSEVWQLIASYARAEYAAMTIDEHDQFHYWPRGYFATVAGQTVAQELTSDYDTAIPQVDLDHTRIRTICRVSYQQTRVAQIVNTEVVEVREFVAFPPGITEFQVAFDHTAVGVLGGPMELLTATQVGGGGLNPQRSYLSLALDADAISGYATSTEAEATILDWWAGGAVIQIVNDYSGPLYLFNTGDTYPFLGVFGRIVSSNRLAVTESYDAGVDVRGERGLTLTLDRIQREIDARRMARRIVVPQSFPTPVIRSVQMFGDPRRQSGDLIQYSDEFKTGAAGKWRVHAVGHTVDGASYTQEVAAQRAELVGTWGDGVSTWGSGVWAGLEEA